MENARVGQETPTRVLLVDDDELFLQGAIELLTADGRIEIAGVARDGAEALEVAERLAPDLVLMDIGLPALDGVEATRAIHVRTPELPVVMLTGIDERAKAEAALDAGAIGYVQKETLGSEHFADSLLALLELSS
jgi:DNA-binding NarL/FixJ family response regulator